MRTCLDVVIAQGTYVNRVKDAHIILLGVDRRSLYLHPVDAGSCRDDMKKDSRSHASAGPAVS
jgi:hypothetical protein